MISVQDAADVYHSQGLQVIPLRLGEKTPLCNWKEYTQLEQSTADIKRLFPDNQRNIGIIGGAVSGNFCCLDFDSIDGYERAMQNLNFSRIVEQTTVVKTARGYHVYLFTPTPVRTAQFASYNLDIRGSGSYAVAPPSLHPSGSLYSFAQERGIYELASNDALGIVTLSPAKSIKSIAAGVGIDLFAILKGERMGYPSRSEADEALCVRLLTIGWTDEEILGLYSRFAGPLSKFRSKQAGDYGYLRLTIESASRFLTEHKSAVDKKLDELQSAAGTLFVGRTGPTDLAVWQGVLKIARRAGRLENLSISERELSEHVGVSAKTARESLKRNPYIERIQSATPTQTARYDISSDIPPHTNNQNRCGGMGSFVSRFINHDAFDCHALGKAGLQLIDVLNRNLDALLTVRQISEKAQVTERTVRRKLEVLQRERLLESEKVSSTAMYRLSRRIDKHELDRLAVTLHSSGKGLRRRVRHIEEWTRYREAKRCWREQNSKLQFKS